MSQGIALFCLVYPADAEKKERVSTLLKKNLPYYRSQKGKCTTWSYFTPSRRKGALGGNDAKELVIAGMEVYTEKSALSTQMADDSFKTYHAAVKTEGLYEKDEDLVAWNPRGGYFSRGPTSEIAGQGVIVITAKFICKNGNAAKNVVERLAIYAQWVKENEPGVLSYSVMDRSKDAKEVLIFERYLNLEANKAHASTAEFRAMFKDIGGHLGGPPALREWTEWDGSFAGNVIGGQVPAKL